MKSLRSTRASFTRLNSRQHVHHGRAFSTSIRTSSGRSIEVPTSQTTKRGIQIPTVSTCPAPTCACGETPTGLDIDHTKSLRGLMPRYTRHIVIRTGQDDWESRIEDGTIGGENSGSTMGSNLARELKELVGPKGKYYNVCTCQNGICDVLKHNLCSLFLYFSRMPTSLSRTGLSTAGADIEVEVSQSILKDIPWLM